jgi:hypothetical protein
MLHQSSQRQLFEKSIYFENPLNHAYKHALFVTSVYIALTCLRIIPNYGEPISYGVLGLYSLSGPIAVIRALFLSQFFVTLNPGIADTTAISSAGRFLVLLFASIGAARHLLGTRGSSNFNIAFLWSTLVFCAYLTFHSYAFSQMADVSLLKSIAWTITILTVTCIWGTLDERNRNLALTDIFLGVTFTLLVSIPLISSPVGFLRNGVGFQGILNQPQLFGVTAGLLLTYATAKALSGRSHQTIIYLILSMAAASVFLSKARVAMLSPVLAITASLAFSLISKRLSSSMLNGLKRPLPWVFLALVIVLLTLRLDTIQSYLSDFLSKGRRAGFTSIFEAYSNSRGVKVEQMQRNISSDPWVGVGFGMPSGPAYMMEIKRDPIFDLPVGAPVEKGMLPLAVFEETGIIGFAIFMIWMIIALFSASGGTSGQLPIFMYILISNLVEATLLSPGGLGLVFLILLGWCITPEHKYPNIKAISTAQGSAYGSRGIWIRNPMQR